MEKTPAGCKDYDVKIGGVSPITTYRETFADKVRDGGVDGLIKPPANAEVNEPKTARDFDVALYRVHRQLPD